MPILFLLPAEKAHHITTTLLRLILSIPGFKSLFRNYYTFSSKNLERELFGLTFKNPIGLAAGFDKEANLIDEMACLGFGFIEIGTITPKPQPGNPQPRLFRLPKDKSLINRMGFNNGGIPVAVENLRKRKSKIVVGGNIGKNKTTPNENAVNDYLKCFNELYDFVDYFVVNVSSPNTPNLRELQEKEPLKQLLQSLQEANKLKPAPKPILLKIAPDLTNSQLDDIVEITKELQLDGLIATNTTIDRSSLQTSEDKIKAVGAGGLSGKALSKKSTEVISYLNWKLSGEVPVIAVGGVFNAQDAIEKLEAGASLVQIYTGLVYEGPSMIKDMNKKLAANYG